MNFGFSSVSQLQSICFLGINFWYQAKPRTKIVKPIKYGLKGSSQEKVEFTISGMTCESCGEHVNHEVNKLTGIISSNASYENGNAIIEFDNSKTNISEIEKAINSTGYSVTDKKEN